MESKVLARIGAVMFIAIAITATVIEMTRPDDTVSVSPAPTPILRSSSDPLRAALRNCQQMGEAAANDAECLRVWAETRDRFLGRKSEPAASEPEERW